MTNLINAFATTIKKEKILSLSNIFIMTITFLVLGIFIAIIAYSQTAIKILEEQAQITVFFKDDFPEDKIMEIKSQLDSDERISEVNYVSKEDAYKIFMDINKDEPVILESASPSILPASLEIKARQLSSLTKLSEEYSTKDGVEDVKFFRDVIDKLKYWSTVILIGSAMLLSIFIFISYSLILNTLRTTIKNKGTELEIMKLVGASDEYVKKPLILQGVSFGIFSSIVASIIVAIILISANLAKILPTPVKINGLFVPTIQINQFVFIAILSALLIASGAALGYFGSSSAIKKYLKY